jgi:hypothetical protein
MQLQHGELAVDSDDGPLEVEDTSSHNRRSRQRSSPSSSQANLVEGEDVLTEILLRVPPPSCSAPSARLSYARVRVGE